MEIDLSAARGALVFDVAPGGRGLNSHRSPVGDGLDGPPQLGGEDRRLTLTLTPMQPGARGVFYLDLDDMGPSGGTIVRLEDLAGAKVRARFEGPRGASTELEGELDARAEAKLAPPACV